MGEGAWFRPEATNALTFWFFVGYFGLGLLLWGLLLGWWDGFFMLVFRTLSWMFTGIVPVMVTTDALAYGWDFGAASVGTMVFGVFFTGVATAMLVGSLSRW